MTRNVTHLEHVNVAIVIKLHRLHVGHNAFSRSAMNGLRTGASLSALTSNRFCAAGRTLGFASRNSPCALQHVSNCPIRLRGRGSLRPATVTAT